MDNPTFAKKLTRPGVLGEFKMAGSRDPDVLQAVRERLVSNSKTTKNFGMVSLVISLVLIAVPFLLSSGNMVVLIIGLVVLGPLALFGWVQRSRGVGNIKLVDGVLAEFTGGTAEDAARRGEI